MQTQRGYTTRVIHQDFMISYLIYTQVLESSQHSGAIKYKVKIIFN